MCIFNLQKAWFCTASLCIWKWKWKLLSNVSLQPDGLYSPWDSPGKNTGVGFCSLLQGIFPTLGSNPGLLHCRWILYCLSSRKSFAYGVPFSRRSSQSRDQTQVSCIAGGFFTSWVTREPQEYWSGWTIPSLVDIPNPGIKLGSPALQVDSLPTKLLGNC